MAIDKKRINLRADQIEDAWKEGAPSVVFRKHKHEDLVNLRAEIAAGENERDDFLTKAALKDKVIDDKYIRLDDMLIDVKDGVIGHDDYGSDSPLYGGMGFKRKSERKSGLTRGKKGGSQVGNG
ncbi:MAG: hypothetical protein WA584_13940 [Pyrinomonadaceae bacterium]